MKCGACHADLGRSAYRWTMFNGPRGALIIGQYGNVIHQCGRWFSEQVAGHCATVREKNGYLDHEHALNAERAALDRQWEAL